MILTFLELDYGLKVHDLMFMDDFMMLNQLVIKGTSLRNYYEKIGKKWGLQGVLEL